VPKGFPRALLAVLVGLGLLGLAGAGTVWAHYRSTPTFREWARAKPVDEALWRRHVPAGVELWRGTSWRSDDGPARQRFGQWRARFTVEHGDELLLDLEVEVRVESREVEDSLARGVPSEAFEGLDVFLVQRGRDPDFHAVAVLTLHESAHPQGPELQLDVFALAGPGDVDLVVQDARGGGSNGPDALLIGRPFAEPSPLGGFDVLAQMLSLEDPPAQGLVYQARTRMHLSWNWQDGQGSTGGFGNTYLRATSRLYSASLKIVQAVRPPFDPPDHFSISRTHSISRSYSWNGEVW
jgi:hypothetical protein